MEQIKCLGEVEAIIEYNDGRPTEILKYHNQVLRLGRQALASALANNFGDSFQLFVSRMLFGDGGVVGSTPRYVDTQRNGLFGTTQASKPVIATINPSSPWQVTFTSVLTYQDANSVSLSEMALQMNNGNFYSMTTFPIISKTAMMQITWNWTLSYV